MSETQAQIEEALTISGEDLTFVFVVTVDNVPHYSYTIIKGIPSTTVAAILSYDSPYDIEKQNYYFLVSALHIQSYGIAATSLFYYDNGNTRYNFRVLPTTSADISGWMTLPVALDSITSLGPTDTGVTIPISMQSINLIVKDEGTVVATTPASINFVGSGITATAVGNDITVTTTGGGASSSDMFINAILFG
jgi:hypothetical protein